VNEVPLAYLSTIQPAGFEPLAGWLEAFRGSWPAGWLDWLWRLGRLDGLKAPDIWAKIG
jgi:hypothetical protein